MQLSKLIAVHVSILGVGAFLVMRAAIPCSLVAPSETAGPFGMTGAKPLLILERSTDARLLGPSGAVAVERVEPDPKIAAARGANGLSLLFFTPVEPLAEGQYTFDDGRVEFTVADPALDREPGLGDGGSIQVWINDDDDLPGCGGVSSCGAYSTVVLDVPETTMEGTYLVEFETDDGDAFSRLVAERFGLAGRLHFYAFPEIEQLDDVTLCAKVTSVSTGGSLGATVDLGCAKAE
jgi:hypothetical protein